MALAIDLRPFSTAEGTGFKIFLESVGIKLLSRSQVPIKIHEIIELTERSLTDNFIDVKNMCLYIDHWTFKSEKYLAVFTSYLNDFEIKFALLDFVNVLDKCSDTTSIE